MQKVWGRPRNALLQSPCQGPQNETPHFLAISLPSPVFSWGGILGGGWLTTAVFAEECPFLCVRCQPDFCNERNSWVSCVQLAVSAGAVCSLPGGPAEGGGQALFTRNDSRLTGCLALVEEGGGVERKRRRKSNQVTWKRGSLGPLSLAVTCLLCPGHGLPIWWLLEVGPALAKMIQLWVQDQSPWAREKKGFPS